MTAGKTNSTAARAGEAECPADELANCRCGSCGYRLRGLTVESACPECGMPVVRSLRAERLADQPIDWLTRTDRGLRVLRAGAIALLLTTACAAADLLAPILFAYSSPVPSAWWWTGMRIAAIGICIGLLLGTSRRSNRFPRRSWFEWLRVLTRASACGLIGCTVLDHVLFMRRDLNIVPGAVCFYLMIHVVVMACHCGTTTGYLCIALGRVERGSLRAELSLVVTAILLLLYLGSQVWTIADAVSQVYVVGFRSHGELALLASIAAWAIWLLLLTHFARIGVRLAVSDAETREIVDAPRGIRREES